MSLFKFQTKQRDLDFDMVGIIEANTAEEAAEKLMANRVSSLKNKGAIIMSTGAKQEEESFMINITASVRWTRIETNNRRIHTDSWTVWPVSGPIVPFVWANGKLNHAFAGIQEDIEKERHSG